MVARSQVWLCGVMLAATFTLSVAGLRISDAYVLLAVTLVVAVVVLAAFSVLLNPLIAKVHWALLLLRALP